MSTNFSSYSVLRQASALMLAGSLLADDVPGYSLTNQIALIQWVLSIVPKDNPSYYSLSGLETELLTQKSKQDALISAIVEQAMSIPETDLIDITDAVKTKAQMEAYEAKRTRRRTLSHTIEDIFSALKDDDDYDENVCDDEDL
jgi:hypothetical protein